jgi:hypothetical protein
MIFGWAYVDLDLLQLTPLLLQNVPAEATAPIK